jgi:predicted Zn-dependent peptidase
MSAAVWVAPTAMAAAIALGASAIAAHASPLVRHLSNGATVIVRENRAAPVVAASVFVRAGQRWEDEATAGITNFLQQVMVKGTTSRSALDVAEAAEQLGGSISASADTDHAEIRGTALARHWRRLLDLVADVTLRPALSPAEIDTERRMVLSGIGRRADEPFQHTLDTLRVRLYGAHPYGLPALGRPEVVKRLGREDLVVHHRRFYRGPRVVVSVSGDIDAPEVAAEAGRLFAELPAGPGAEDPPLPAPHPAPDRFVWARPAAQAQVMAAVLAPPISHPDYAAVKVLATVLGGGMSGRLFTELRERQGLAYSAGAFFPSRVGPGFLATYLGTAPANAERAEEAVRREIERLRMGGVSEEEVARAKAYVLGQFALDRRTNARLAWYQAFFESAGVGHDFDHRYRRDVEAVSRADVERVARTYLAAPTTVVLSPAPR